MNLATREAGTAFADLICDDPQWLDAEFDALVSASFGEPPAPPPPAPPRVPPRPGIPCPPSRDPGQARPSSPPRPPGRPMAGSARPRRIPRPATGPPPLPPERAAVRTTALSTGQTGRRTGQDAIELNPWRRGSPGEPRRAGSREAPNAPDRMLWIPRIVLGFIGCQTYGRHLRRWRTALPRAGHDQIKAVYTEFLANRPSLGSAGQQPAIINGDIALTSTGCPAAVPRLRSPASSPTEPGAGSSTSRPYFPEQTRK